MAPLTATGNVQVIPRRALTVAVTTALKVVPQKASEETVQATTNAWQPLFNQVRQGIKTKITKSGPSICLAPPNDLSKEIMVVLLHAHLQNIIAPEMSVRHHAR